MINKQAWNIFKIFGQADWNKQAGRKKFEIMQSRKLDTNSVAMVNLSPFEILFEQERINKQGGKIS